MSESNVSISRTAAMLTSELSELGEQYELYEMDELNPFIDKSDFNLKKIITSIRLMELVKLASERDHEVHLQVGFITKYLVELDTVKNISEPGNIVEIEPGDSIQILDVRDNIRRHLDSIDDEPFVIGLAHERLVQLNISEVAEVVSNGAKVTVRSIYGE